MWVMVERYKLLHENEIVTVYRLILDSGLVMTIEVIETHSIIHVLVILHDDMMVVQIIYDLYHIRLYHEHGII